MALVERRNRAEHVRKETVHLFFGLEERSDLRRRVTARDCRCILTQQPSPRKIEVIAGLLKQDQFVSEQPVLIPRLGVVA